VSIDELCAALTCVILTGLAVFQGALIAGAPLGRLAGGGQHHVLPLLLRIASAASIVTYGLFAYIALAKADIAPFLINESFTSVLVWVLTAYFTVGCS
jgi:glycerol-3-phosphate acyltransferase PlsY